MLRLIPETRKQKEDRLMKLPKRELVMLLCNSHEVMEQLREAYNNKPIPNAIPCDVCGNHPNTIITTQFGRYCQEHAKYI